MRLSRSSFPPFSSHEYHTFGVMQHVFNFYVRPDTLDRD